MSGGVLSNEQWARWWAEAGATELGELLHWRWDPIGVSDEFPAARDEYDMYVPEIGALLKNRGDSTAIAHLLTEIEQNRMGLRPNEARVLEFAEVVTDWCVGSIGRWEGYD